MGIAKYLGDVKSEMHQVTWPSKKELKGMSTFTVITLAIGGVLLWIIDTGIVLGLTAVAR